MADFCTAKARPLQTTQEPTPQHRPCFRQHATFPAPCLDGMQQPSASIYFGPAGDEKKWEKDMNYIDKHLVTAFANALKEHGTCIPKDKQNDTIKANASKKSSKEFVSWVEELLVGNGSPHCAHISKRITDRKGTPFKFTKKLLSREPEII